MEVSMIAAYMYIELKLKLVMLLGVKQALSVNTIHRVKLLS